jgi:hypothetical protein
MAARRQLLHARVVDEIRGLDPGRTEIVELVRQSELNMCCRCWKSSSCYCTMSPFPCLALDSSRMQLSQAAVYGRVQSLPFVLRLGRGSAIVSGTYESS